MGETESCSRYYGIYIGLYTLYCEAHTILSHWYVPKLILLLVSWNLSKILVKMLQFL